MAIEVTCFSDPGCPWAYSATPALTVLQWRYGDQLDWRLVTIGLTEDRAQYEERGYTPARMANGYVGFRRFGMPFAVTPREHVTATGRACRAIVAVRLADPQREWAAFRALQYSWMTSSLLLDTDEALSTALAEVVGLDVAAVIATIDSDAVEYAYQTDRAESRTAAGGPTEFQGKSAQSDGPVRFTAPSLILRAGERHLEAGGFQPVEAYDVLIANLDPTLQRRAPAEDPVEVLQRFPDGLSTQEIAATMAAGNDAPSRERAERLLIDAAAEGHVGRVAIGDDALWTAT